ncbi:MAG: hypothetical protein EYC67_12910 [Betaproteobacteria bacterium]|nr:MAG: hypothetical protein EYC67_12910 [Betaproteobacteria bacterium]
MRRWLAILLLCLLPLQVSWAAVADYCAHEHDRQAQHFGHHDDEHTAWSGPSDSPDTGGKVKLAHDHNHNHLSGFVGLLAEPTGNQRLASTSIHPDHGTRTYPAVPPDQPERPQWSRPA